ncbi:hypothetical protein XA68_10371 [Ophiocordyceps unilateralis]|uniref:Uncharacterized protein n=1 Tax=Ophiocordyceps unilateralis TaxID=268505 RepID=A0A2A9PIQ0_OPHUN|nr:hypothetical protein XA68_10371 [Ophiocordyceps unilateralis]
MARDDVLPILPSNTARPGVQPLRNAWAAIRNLAVLVWKWSVPHRNSHRPGDAVYASVWGSSFDKEALRDALHAALPEVARDQLPDEEEQVRSFLRDKFHQTSHDEGEGSGSDSILLETPEEAWPHIPFSIRSLLAAANASHLEAKLSLLLQDNFHPAAGLGSLNRSTAGVQKTFRMWRQGFVAAVSLRERVGVNIFFVVLACSAVYPDVAAGFLGERSYNQRSIGSRIVTLIQLYFLWTFPFHSLWLLFNWSLERLLGAFVGNSVYALVALVPAVRGSYRQAWFRTMMLVLSMSWQIGVQFSPTVRDYVMRLVVRRQMRALRRQTKTGDDGIDWTSVDKSIERELMSQKAFVEQRISRDATLPAWDEVPIKVRAERYIHFTSSMELGRSADQLIGLLKNDLEGIIETLEDYRSTAPCTRGQEASSRSDRGHVEPRAPKFFLVFFDIAIFAYVCYSFWTQPFTFNTVVAYSTVVVIKQTILALKRYQTVKGARRLFTNMVSINILGMLLVSTPVTIDRKVLENNGNMVALTLAMVFATLFLAEPIAPALLTLTEKSVAASSRLAARLGGRKRKDGEGTKEQRN